VPRSSRACFCNFGLGAGSGAVLCTYQSAKRTRRSRAVRKPFCATGSPTRKSATPTGRIGTTADEYTKWKPPRTCSPAGTIFFLRELLDAYEALIAAGKTPHLRVGPSPRGSLGMMAEVLRETFVWFDLHLKGEPDKAPTKPVRLYVMGADEWRKFDAWPPPAEETCYHLHPGGLLYPQAPPFGSLPDGYRYDPADPTPAVGGPLFSMSGKRGAVDNRDLESRPDVLVYTTPPLEGDVEIIGPVRLELYAGSSLRHADFFGRLCDVHPDGESVNVCDGLFRLEPGEGEQQQDGSSRIEIDMWATAYRFRRGHRLRLQVSSGAHPRWNRNLCTGEPIATATTMLAAEQTVYHNREHPSAVILPVSVSTSRA
jgi:putative CocE/NonD family hydrolase